MDANNIASVRNFKKARYHRSIPIVQNGAVIGSSADLVSCFEDVGHTEPLETEVTLLHFPPYVRH